MKGAPWGASRTHQILDFWIPVKSHQSVRAREVFLQSDTSKCPPRSQSSLTLISKMELSRTPSAVRLPAIDTFLRWESREVVRVAVPAVHPNILNFPLITFSRAARMRLPRTTQEGPTETGREVGAEARLPAAGTGTGRRVHVRTLRVQTVQRIGVVLVETEVPVRSAGHWKRLAGWLSVLKAPEPVHR